MIDFKVTGVSLGLAKMEAADKVLGKQFQMGLHNAGMYIKKESKAIVPVDTGALKKSASTRNVGGQGWKADQIVSYGNDEVDYAEVVHERLDLRHKPPTKAEYLSDIFKYHTAQIIAIIHKAMGM